MRNPGTYPLYLGAVAALVLMFAMTNLHNVTAAVALTLVCGLVALCFPIIALSRAISRYRGRTQPGEGAAIYYSAVCIVAVALFVVSSVADLLV